MHCLHVAILEIVSDYIQYDHSRVHKIRFVLQGVSQNTFRIVFIEARF